MCQVRARRPVPAPTCVVRFCRAGFEARGKAQGRPVPSGRPQARGIDRTGELREPPLMPRKAEPSRWDAVAGCKDWPLRSGGRRLSSRLGREEHRRPRDRGGTHPGRSSCVRNAVTPSGSGLRFGKPTVRKAQSPGGNRMTEKRNAGGRKAAGNRDVVVGPSSRSSRITGRIRTLVVRPERALTRSGEPVRKKMTEAPEPEDKLDTTTTCRGERTRGRDPCLAPDRLASG